MASRPTRKWIDALMDPRDHDRFCRQCDGHGSYECDGVIVPCDVCDGVRRRPVWEEHDGSLT